jgi:hypothetical protein
MLRTQISLTHAQMARLRAESLRCGVSIAQLIRDAVDQVFPAAEWEARKARAIAAIGCIREQADDVAERHDEYLANLPVGR